MNGFKRLWSGASGRKLRLSIGAALAPLCGIWAGCAEVNMDAADWWAIGVSLGLASLAVLGLVLMARSWAEKRKGMSPEELRKEYDDQVM